MKKNCQKCSITFECNVEDIANCQCMSFRIEKAESDYILKNYSDCLCSDCLTILKKDYKQYLMDNIKSLLK